MSQFDASDLDCTDVQCAVCESVIKGGKWFARINILIVTPVIFVRLRERELKKQTKAE